MKYNQFFAELTAAGCYVLGTGLIMIFGTALKRETSLLCQGMANRKYLPGWNVKRERFFWGSNPPIFCASWLKAVIVGTMGYGNSAVLLF
jgi:hypothetical protein